MIRTMPVRLPMKTQTVAGLDFFYRKNGNYGYVGWFSNAECRPFIADSIRDLIGLANQWSNSPVVMVEEIEFEDAGEYDREFPKPNRYTDEIEDLNTNSL